MVAVSAQLPIALLLAACDPAEPLPFIEVGGGETRFEPLAEGQPHTIVHGPQGGWHMLGSVRTHGFDEIVSIRFVIEAVEMDGAVVSDQYYRVQCIEDPDDPDALYYPGLYGYLDVEALAQGELDTPPELLSYQQVRLQMIVDDTLGHQAQASVQVQAEPDPDDLDMVP